MNTNIQFKESKELTKTIFVGSPSVNENFSLIKVCLVIGHWFSELPADGETSLWKIKKQKCSSVD